VTKQADVELLAYPLEYVTDGEQIARDLDYYSTVIDPDGPAMSFSVYAILSAQLGRAEEAYQYFRRSYEPNTRPPFHAFSETPTNNEFFFCTGVGGALQGLLFGFTGLRLREGYFALNPILPPKWTALRFRQLYVSSMRTDIEIERESLTIRRHLPQGMLELHIPHRDRPTVSCRWDGRPGAQLLLAVDDGNGHAFREQIGPNQAVDLPVACDGQRIVVSADGEAPALDFFLRTERA
jgi:trehalose/maltose hydrolase-like predicted phosphorylase